MVVSGDTLGHIWDTGVVINILQIFCDPSTRTASVYGILHLFLTDCVTTACRSSGIGGANGPVSLRLAAQDAGISSWTSPAADTGGGTDADHLGSGALLLGTPRLLRTGSEQGEDRIAFRTSGAFDLSDSVERVPIPCMRHPPVWTPPRCCILSRVAEDC